MLALLAFWVSPRAAWAYPELVRHNYPNCTSCHVSPNGGGLLTQYGRKLSAAILSTWGTGNEKEPEFAYGLVPLPSWLDAQGMYRGVYAYQDTPFIQQGKYIYMQGDLEAAAHLGKWTLDATLGYQNPPSAASFGDHILSRRHFVNYQATDEFSLRGGRFFPAYGINTPDHVIPTREDIGWDYASNQESYNLEGAWIGSKWNVIATVDFGRPDSPDLHHETGGALTGSVALADHHKVGLSYFHGDAQTTTRNLVGPWAILGFTPHFYLLTEVDFQQKANKSGGGDPQWGAVNYQKLGYEVLQGLHFYATQDYSRLDFKDASTIRNSFGLGTQFFPRPHFELNFEWQKLKNVAVSPEYTDFAWLMLNFYL